MTLSLRLPRALTLRLERAARREGISKSEFVRQCLEERFAVEENAVSAWELGQGLFGRFASGKPNLARSHKDIVKQKLQKKRGRL
jgi:predicted DNA-binding protein